MTRRYNRIVVGLLIAVAAAIVIALQLRAPADVAVAAPAPTAASPTVANPTGSGSAAVPKARVRRFADPSGRAEMLRQIRAVHAKRTATTTSGSSSKTASGAPALPTPTLEEYIRASVRELLPLLAECYEQGLARDPKLGGSVIVDFTIEGESEVGGVVSESLIDETSTLTDPAVRECIQETMFAIEIEPPEGGGVVKVRYPFEFRAGPE